MRNNFWYTYHKLKLEEQSVDPQEEDSRLSNKQKTIIPRIVAGVFSYYAQLAYKLNVPTLKKWPSF